MKKLCLLVLLGIFSLQVSASELKLRTNLFANLFSIYNAGVEFKTSEKYSLEANFWNTSSSSTEDYEGSSLTKYGILGRAYNKKRNAYFGIGVAVLASSAGDIQTEDATATMLDLKVGQDFSVTEAGNVTLGYSVGTLFSQGGHLPNFGFNLTYKI
ncbi:hypothetical protein DID76_01200 [Candidatus Marinamargulisbacteria bacterium SCGC AG-414-C22]|nr:hypothetical protein DID76_01200 [Candidatus Marinamargulisbacteria bacterium SCGC AG-414-C22]